MNFKDELGKRFLIFDGAMGTMLQSVGLAPGVLPESLNISAPEKVEHIHSAYLAAGCDIIKTNTFGANPIKLRGSSLSLESVLGSAFEIAKKAVSGCGRKAYIAMDAGPLGKLLAPYGELSFEEAYEAYAATFRFAEGFGADLILIETISDLYEARAALLAAKEVTSLPVLITFTFDKSGRLFSGADAVTALSVAQALGADAAGANCGFGPDLMKPVISQMLSCADIPIFAGPNAGLPHIVSGQTCFETSPEDFADAFRELFQMGISIAGGCCGTTPAHIKALADCAPRIFAPAKASCKPLLITSGVRHLALGTSPVIIGERINPTGKPKLKSALKSGDFEFIRREGISQQQDGAAILDVNVGLPGIDEPSVLSHAVQALQSVCDIPLCIDSPDPAALSKALRIYNGVPLINSVCGKPESLETVLPLAKKYGAALIALALDEKGIPDTSSGRVKIAEKIVRTAEDIGIASSRLLIDPLTMTVGTDSNSARITLGALDILTHELGLHTVLGVSNISFGLPERQLLNSAFLTLALGKGLSAAIMNPRSAPMMDAWRSYLALSGLDAGCTEYVKAYANINTASVPESHLPPAVCDCASPLSAEVSERKALFDSVTSGLRESSGNAALHLCKNSDPLDIIENVLIPALTHVGEEFERGKIFLPQLLMSADAAKEAFSVLREVLPPSESSKGEKRLILATVKGDIHDIGKNIVKTVLESHGFDVIDLGKDVEPQAIVDCARENNIQLVGLSALMTTTVGAMELTTALIHENLPDCRVLVGGAVLSADYAQKIGADAYAKDAMASVKYAKSVLG